MPLYRYRCKECGRGLEYLLPYDERLKITDCALCKAIGSIEPLAPCPNVHIYMEDGASESTGILKEEDFIFIEGQEIEK